MPKSTFSYVKVVSDTYGRFCIVTDKTEVPDKMWLAGQEKKFSDDPDCHDAYPISGGAVIIDLNQCIEIGQMRSDAIEAIAKYLGV